jgi:hypothetical protein
MAASSGMVWRVAALSLLSLLQLAVAAASDSHCAHLEDTGGGKDQKRCEAYPNGVANATLASCCGLCAPDNTINCTSWIFHAAASGSGRGTCWPMEYAVGTRPNPGTVIGGTIRPPPAGPIPPQPPLPSTGECSYTQDTAFDAPADGDTWLSHAQATSAGECCAICRSIPECHVSNFQPPIMIKVRKRHFCPLFILKMISLPRQARYTHRKHSTQCRFLAKPNTIAGGCTLRGKVDMTKPTHIPNGTACLVKTRPAPARPAPAGGMNVLYIVSDDARPEVRKLRKRPFSR